MEVKVEDLKKGDEILSSCYTDVVYLRILQDPRPHKTAKRYDGTPYYLNIKCEVNKKIIPTKYGHTTKYSCTPIDEGTGTVVRKNLNGRVMWLLNRK